jgi:hypothetical protein
MTLTHCARVPCGIKRSLACLDLAHRIDPALGSESIYSDFLLRPTDPKELAEWLWQLIRRWKKWNIKVVSTPERWTVAMDAIAPKGILELLLYFWEQNANDQPECWERMLRIALKRTERESAALIDAGQNPDVVKERVMNLAPSFGTQRAQSFDLGASASLGSKLLLETIRPDLYYAYKITGDTQALLQEQDWMGLRQNQNYLQAVA